MANCFVNGVPTDPKKTIYFKRCPHKNVRGNSENC